MSRAKPDSRGTDDDTKSDQLAVLRAARQGDRRSWDLLATHYYPRILRFLTHLAGDSDLAADLAQDTFVRAVTHLDRLDSDAAFATWLYRIARNAWISWIRSQRLRRLVSLAWLEQHEHEGDNRLDGTGEIEHCHERLLVQQALNELKPAAREVFVLRRIEGWTSDEIAAFLGTSTGTAQRRINRAEEQFRARCRAIEQPRIVTGEHPA